MKKEMDIHVEKINKNLIIGWMIIVVVLAVSYSAEVLKGQRTLSYLSVFILVTVLPAIFCCWRYKQNPKSHMLRYSIVIGYFVMYLFCMMTGSTTMVFSYILPMLSLLVLFHQPNLILFTGIASLIVNIISIVFKALAGKLTLENSNDAEIQIALIVLCFLGSYLATRLYDTITKENNQYMQELDFKNSQIQKMTFQTIATIANTIDAKDEYTKGHSKRVSEYSALIAEKMGLPQNEVQSIRFVALLHDIGKIGVPDSVLNKPGKLTQEEYHLMKQHTVMGGEILKDIGILEGIDIGARHHHERYDGKGYPEGLKGEEIPYIARIISVADAYDAMTSNRVYRRKIDMPKVIEELKNGKGTQFDPKAAQAMIELATSQMAENIRNEDGADDASTILGRILEKNEEKMTEQLLMDDLTSVYNRNYGEKIIRETLESKKGCLMLFDLDYFRYINDTYGFIKGDHLLRVTVEGIRSIPLEKIIARFGGNEFTVFFPDLTDEKIAEEYLVDFYDFIEKKRTKDVDVVDLSISVGAVLTEKEKCSFSDLYLCADKALYYAKQQGGGQSYFHHSNLLKEELSYAGVDLQELLKNVYDKNLNYVDKYVEIKEIYEQLLALTQDDEKKNQVVMFTVVMPKEKKRMDLKDTNIMEYLERAIITTVRSKDITAKFSNTQRIVVFQDIDDFSLQKVIDRILRNFYKMTPWRGITVHYDRAQLNQNK